MTIMRVNYLGENPGASKVLTMSSILSDVKVYNLHALLILDRVQAFLGLPPRCFSFLTRFSGSVRAIVDELVWQGSCLTGDMVVDK